MERETNIQILEVLKFQKRGTPRYVIIQVSKVKDKERILKAAGKKIFIYKETPLRLQADV